MDRKLTEAPKRLGKVAVVAELDRDRNDPPAWWRVTVSLPGREGTLTKVWDVPGPQMEMATYDDLVGWLVNTFAQAVVLTTGVQGSLLT